jgi:hypothetical protein
LARVRVLFSKQRTVQQRRFKTKAPILALAKAYRMPPAFTQIARQHLSDKRLIFLFG